MAKQEVEHSEMVGGDVGLTAIVNQAPGDYDVTLYHQDGIHTMRCTADEVEFWVGQGQWTDRPDLEELYNRLCKAFTGATTAVGSFVDELKISGVVDPRDGRMPMLANAAMREIATTWDLLSTAAYRLNPVLQWGDEGIVKMVDPGTGQEHDVHPNAIEDLKRMRGWVLAAGSATEGSRE